MQIDDLVKEGCAIETAMCAPRPVAAIEIRGNKLSWVTQFPVSQQHCHVIVFDRIKETGKAGIGFHIGNQRVAYVALFNEFVNVDPVQLLRERSAWQEYPSDKDRREVFQSFVQREKETLLSVSYETSTAGKTEERIDGATPNGGLYNIAYFSDADDNPTVKSKAKRMEIVEFDKNGNQIHRTYMEQ